MYNLGTLAWARIGGHPFWPCLVTKEPDNNVFKKDCKFNTHCIDKLVSTMCLFSIYGWFNEVYLSCSIFWRQRKKSLGCGNENDAVQ